MSHHVIIIIVTVGGQHVTEEKTFDYTILIHRTLVERGEDLNFDSSLSQYI
jgi:hypothetical protein